MVRANRMRDGWGRASLLVPVVAALSGCASIHDGFGTRREPVAVSDATSSRPGGRPVRVVAPDEDGGPVGTERAVPSPKEIFDFHPAGSKPDAWRAPFLIDTDDGPLRAEIRHSNEELRRYREDEAKGSKGSVSGKVASKTCGEDDVAHGKPGCPKPPPPKPVTTLDKDPLAIR